MKRRSCSLGGGSLFLGEDVGFGSRESVEDCGRVLGQYVDVIVSRTREHQSLTEFASHCACSVINGLSEQAHPCQALADLYTIREQLGGLKTLRLAWIGDGNNVARSLAIGCAKMGYSFVAASPPGYQLEASYLDEVRAAVPGAQVEQVEDPSRGGAGCRSRLYRRLGEHGAGSGEASAGRDICRLSGRRRTDGVWHPSGRSSCTACRPTGAWK